MLSAGLQSTSAFLATGYDAAPSGQKRSARVHKTTVATRQAKVRNRLRRH